MRRWGMMKRILAIAALVFPVGCACFEDSDSRMPDNVIGLKTTVPKSYRGTTWQGEANLRKLAEEFSVTVISSDSALVGVKDAAPPARAPEPVSIDKVDPSGQAGQLSAGTQRGMQKGQTLNVMRRGKMIGVARVISVQSNTSEIVILWSADKLFPGDTVVPR
jgi:hypothetical protein